MEHHRALAGLCAPTVNAYKRLKPAQLSGYWAQLGLRPPRRDGARLGGARRRRTARAPPQLTARHPSPRRAGRGAAGVAARRRARVGPGPPRGGGQRARRDRGDRGHPAQPGRRARRARGGHTRSSRISARTSSPSTSRSSGPSGSGSPRRSPTGSWTSTFPSFSENVADVRL